MTPALAQSLTTITAPDPLAAPQVGGSQLLTPNSAYTQFIINDQRAMANQNSMVSSSAGQILSTAASQLGTGATLSTNSSYSGAFGNIVDPNAIDLFLAQSVLGPVGILSGQSRASLFGGPVVTSATQNNTTFGVTQIDQAVAAKTVTGNSITSQAQLNTATNIIAGQVPVNFSAVTPASISIGFGGSTLQQGTSSVSGAIQISNTQSSLNAGARAGSVASVTGSTEKLDISNVGGLAASAPLSLTDNSIAATFGGNTATNRMNVGAGAGVALQGGVALSNGQFNEENTGSNTAATARISTSAITADIRSRDATAMTTLTAPLVVSNNSLSASSNGNSAAKRTANGMVAGNSLTIATGVDVLGNGVSGNANLANAATQQGFVIADLALASVQSNQSTNFDSQVNSSSPAPLQSGVVSVRADQIGAAGSITTSSNAVNAAASGNLAANFLSADNARLNGTVAAGNSQRNDGTAISGSVSWGSVTVNVGPNTVAPVGLPGGGSQGGGIQGGPGSGTVLPVSGAITLGTNSIAASAEGNTAVTSVSLNSTNLTSQAAAGNISSSNADASGPLSASATSGVAASNLQQNTGTGPIGAIVDSSFVAVNVKDQTTNGTPLADLKSANVSVAGNAITSGATGNSAGTSVALSGSNGVVQSAVANTQYNAVAVTAANGDSGVSVRAGDVSGASAITLTGNTVSSAAMANDASNSLSATGFANLTVGPNVIGQTPTASATSAIASNTAAVGISSAQRNTETVNASTSNTLSGVNGGGFATVYAGQPTTGAGIGAASTVQASNNSVSASTMGNRVANTVALGASTLDTTANAATQIAAIANSQKNDTAGVANATVDGGLATTAVGVTFNREIAASSVAASGNQLTATSLGNRAANTLVASGNLSSAAPVVAAGSVGLYSSGVVQQEFAVASQQTDSVLGGRTATIQDSTVGVANAAGASGAVTSIGGSTLTANGNRLVAEARSNDVSNAIRLSAPSTLGSSAGLMNNQFSDTNVAAKVVDSGVRVQALGDLSANTYVSSSNLSVSNNAVQGLAIGSSAQNTMSASAATLSGNSGVTSSGAIDSSPRTAAADYAIGSYQDQSGQVNANVRASTQVLLANSAGGSSAGGSSAVLSGNTTAAIAQATSASNDLSLAASGAASGLTGTVYSGQLSRGSTASLASASGATGVANVSVREQYSTPVSVTGNSLRASAGGNESFNNQSVSGASIAGSGLLASTDFAVVNSQDVVGNSVTASANPGLLGVASNVVAISAVAVSGNSVTSSANGNTGVNGLGIAATGNVAASGGVTNTQWIDSAVLAKQGDIVPTDVGLLPLSATSPSRFQQQANVTVTGNTVATQASANSASNNLSVTGATIAGGAGFNGATALQQSGLISPLTQSFSTVNAQESFGNVAASSVLGTVGATVQDAYSSNFAVSGNTLSASAKTNTASSLQTMAATSTLSGSGAVSNRQQDGSISVSNSVSASLTTGAVGLASPNGGTSGFQGSSVAVTGNQLNAEAGRNTATNVLSASAATMTGSFTATNAQEAYGTTTASNVVGSIGSGVSTAGSTSFAVTGNTAGAVATGNVATTAVRLAGTSALAGTGIAENTQNSSQGVVNAMVSSTSVGVQGVSLSGSPVTVSGNVLNAEATRNTATNSLVATAPSMTGTTTALPGASFVVRSSQTGDDNTMASNNAGLIGATQDTASNGSFGVTGNMVVSTANVNQVTNQLVLNAASGLSGSGRLENTQSAGVNAPSSVTATASGGLIGVTAATSGNTISSSPVTVSGNVVSAQGGGNTALNAIDTSAVSAIGGSVAYPTYGLLNAQNNAATVTTTVQGFNVGLNAASVGSTASSVVNNRATATSYGNTASNSVAATALSGLSSQASTLISNTQTNSANLSSTVAGLTIGVTGGALGGGSAVVSNNAIVSRSVGNSASNIVSLK